MIQILNDIQLFLDLSETQVYSDFKEKKKHYLILWEVNAFKWDFNLFEHCKISLLVLIKLKLIKPMIDMGFSQSQRSHQFMDLHFSRVKSGFYFN